MRENDPVSQAAGALEQPSTKKPAPGAGSDLPIFAALLAVQLSFGGLHVVGKVVLEAVPPLALAAMRVLFATPVLFLLARMKGSLLPPRDLFPRLLLLGVLGVFLNQVMFISGLKLTTAPTRPS